MPSNLNPLKLDRFMLTDTRIPKLTKLSTGESNRLVRAVLWRFPKPSKASSLNSNKGGH